MRFFEYRKGAFVNLTNVRRVDIRDDEPSPDNVSRVYFQYSGDDHIEFDLEPHEVDALREALTIPEVLRHESRPSDADWRAIADEVHNRCGDC